MFKPFIVLIISSLSLSGIVYAQEKGAVSVPAFLMPASVVRTSTVQPGLSDNPEAKETVSETPDAPGARSETPYTKKETPAAFTESTHQLEYLDPSGTRQIFHSTKPIRITAAEKDSRPIRSAVETKSEVK